MPRTLILRPPAKINLWLRVGARRADGRHDVQTLFQSIAIGDTLRITARAGAFALEADSADVPADRTNLVWRAAESLWRATGREGDPRDAHVRLGKAVPVGAGLGGGSADAAAALVGLNTIWRARLSPPTLATVGASLGADVPFFLSGGTAVGLGAGDEILPAADIARLSLVIVAPKLPVSTADAYRWLDEDRAAGLVPDVDRAEVIDVGWPSSPIACVNDLEAPVVRRRPVVGEALAAVRREGAVAAAMTGSGSAVFGVFEPARVARAVRRLERPEWQVRATHTLRGGSARRRIGL